MLKSYLGVFALFYLLLFVGCSDKKPAVKNGSFEDVVFNIDHELLADEIHDNQLRIRYHPIKDWTRQPDDIIEIVEEQTRNEEDIEGLTENLREIFMQMETRQICFLSYMVQDNKTTREDFLNHYLHFFDDEEGILKTGRFKHNGIYFYQIIHQNSDYTELKLLGYHSESDIFVFQFIVPNHLYQKSLKKIESSIGSISIL